MRKATSLILVLSILLLSGDMFAKEKKGAALIIQKKDGTQVRGELIAVKENSLLLMERDSGADATIDFRDIGVIRIVKKLKVLRGVGLGLIIGSAGGTLIGYSDGDSELGTPDNPSLVTADQKALIAGILFGILGTVIGGAVGAASGADKTIQIEGKSKSEIQGNLEKLRKKARIKSA